ncbi:MAG: efflux RND transporter periplasmic adaptor subunit [Planctomycetota bacterium]
MNPSASRWLALGAGVLACALALAFLLYRPAASGPQGGPPPLLIPVTLADLRQGDVRPRAHLTGTVRAPLRARLGFEVAGVISELAVLEADAVEAGQVLARLRAGDQELAVAARRAELVVAERQLALAEAGPRPEEKRRLAAEAASAKAEADLARLEVDRGRGLLAQNVTTQADVDRLVARLEGAEARAAGAAARVAEAEAGTRPEDLEIARAAVTRARVALETAEHEAGKTTLRAPFTGVISRRLASVGDHLDLGQAALELVDPTRLEVEVQIPSRYGPRLQTDAPVVVTVDELPGLRIEARLHAKIPVADEVSRNLSGVVRLTREQVLGPDGRPLLQPGIFARLDLTLKPLLGVLIAPADAVRTLPQGTVLVRAQPAPAGKEGPPLPTAEWVTVEVLGTEDGLVAVRGGEPLLQAGERVVLSGVDRAFPGATLAPQAPPSAKEPADVVKERQAAEKKTK